jgi:large subunit ribosomal protein L18
MKKRKNNMKGTSTRPRVSVCRSLRHISVQAVDDDNRKTLFYVSSCQKAVRDSLKKTGNKEASAYVGKVFGEKLKEQKLNKIVFDRNGLLYHGNVKALADAIRKTGIEF